jgi:hypothetical protein
MYTWRDKNIQSINNNHRSINTMVQNCLLYPTPHHLHFNIGLCQCFIRLFTDRFYLIPNICDCPLLYIHPILSKITIPALSNSKVYFETIIIFYLPVLGIELRDSCLLNNCSTTWFISKSLFFRDRLLLTFAQACYQFQSSCLYPPSSWDYWHAPNYLAYNEIYIKEFYKIQNVLWHIYHYVALCIRSFAI